MNNHVDLSKKLNSISGYAELDVENKAFIDGMAKCVDHIDDFYDDLEIINQNNTTICKLRTEMAKEVLSELQQSLIFELKKQITAENEQIDKYSYIKSAILTIRNALIEKEWLYDSFVASFSSIFDEVGVVFLPFDVQDSKELAKIVISEIFDLEISRKK